MAVVWPAAAAGAPAETPDQAVAEAHRLFNEARLAEAARAYAQLLRLHPDHPKAAEVLFFLGEARLRLDQVEPALEVYRQQTRRFPSSPYAGLGWYRLGECLYRLKRYSEAAVALARFLNQPDQGTFTATALAYLGDSYRFTHRINRAAAVYGQAIDRYPHGPGAEPCRFGLAECLYRQGRPDLAAALFEQLAATGQGPLAQRAMVGAARSYFAAGQYGPAVRAFRRWLDSSPTGLPAEQARLELGQAQLVLEDPEAAVRTLEPLVAQPEPGSPWAAPAAYWHAVALKRCARLGEAATALALALKRFGDSPWAADLRLQWAFCQLEQQAYAEAGRQFAEFLLRHPGHGRTGAALYGLCRSEAEAGRHVTACRNAQTALALLGPGRLRDQVTLHYGRSLAALHRYAEAAEQFARLRRSSADPDLRRQARHDEARCLHALSRWKELLEALGPGEAEAVPQDATAAEMAFLRGTALFHTGRWEPAIRWLSAGLKGPPPRPFDPQALAYLAVACARTGKLLDANRYLDRLGQEPAADALLAYALYELGEAAMAAGDLAAAVAWFDVVIARYADSPYHARALSGKAWALYRQRRFAAATQAFAATARLRPSDPQAIEAAFMHARSLEDAGQLTQAIEAYRQFVRTYPQALTVLDAWTRIGRCYAKLHQPEEAVAAFQTVAELFPHADELDVVYYEWAWTLKEQGRDAEAREVFGRLVEKNPGSELALEARLHLAAAAFRQQDLAAARHEVAELLASRPPDRLAEPALYLSGRCAAAAGDWAAAAAAFAELTQRFPQGKATAEALLALAEARLRGGDRPGAEAALRRLIGHKAVEAPLAAKAMLMLAQLLVETGRPEEAKQLCQRLQASYPAFEEMWTVEACAAEARDRLGDLDGAIAAWQQLSEKAAGPTAAQALWKLGRCLARKGVYDEAVRAFYRIEAADPHSPWLAPALLEAAGCFEAAQQWAAAVAAYKELIRRFPDSESAGQARQRLPQATQRLARLRRVVSE